MQSIATTEPSIPQGLGRSTKVLVPPAKPEDLRLKGRSRNGDQLVSRIRTAAEIDSPIEEALLPEPGRRAAME